MGKSKTSQTQTQEQNINQSLDPGQSAQWQNLINTIVGSGYTPYQGQRVANPTANQVAAWQQAGQIGGLGQEQLQAASQAAMNATGYSPQQVSAGQIQGPGAFQGAQAGQVGPIQQVQAQNVNTANTAGQAGGVYGQLRGNIRDVAAGQFGNLSPYMNEYNNQVVNTALGDVERARQMATNQTGDAAAAAGAFGGSRHGVAEAQTNEAYARQSARTAADLRARGFDTAAALQQSDLARSLQAQGMNQGADAGLLEQAFGQTNQNALANQGANLQAGLANQSADLARGQTNAQLGTQASIANMQGRLQNAGLDQNAQMANQDAALRAALANQGAGLTANGQALQGAGLLGNLGAQAQSMGINGMNALGWAGGQEYGIQQAGLDANYQNYLNQQGFDQQRIQNWLGALNAQPSLVNTSMTGSTTQTQERDRFSQLLGAGLAIGGTLLGGPVGGAVGSAIGGAVGGGSGGNMGAAFNAQPYNGFSNSVPQFSPSQSVAPAIGGMIGGAGAMGGPGNQNLNSGPSINPFTYNPKGQQAATGSTLFNGPMMNWMGG